MRYSQFYRRAENISGHGNGAVFTTNFRVSILHPGNALLQGMFLAFYEDPNRRIIGFLSGCSMSFLLRQRTLLFRHQVLYI